MNLSEKLLRILRSKIELTESDFDKLTEREGWSIVYSLQAKKTGENKVEICFTGYSPSEKKELMQIAADNDVHVAKTITKGLMFLCCGPNAGPSKMAKSEKQGVKLIDKETFFNILETGEIPSSNIK